MCVQWTRDCWGGHWPFDSRSSAVLTWPSAAASMSAVRPSLSLALKSAPCFSSSSTTLERRPRGQEAKTTEAQTQSTGASRTKEASHLCVSVFGGAQQRDHPPPVGNLQAGTPLQQRDTHLHPPPAWRCAQRWQTVVIEMSGDKYIIDIFRWKAAGEVTCREDKAAVLMAA